MYVVHPTVNTIVYAVHLVCPGRADHTVHNEQGHAVPSPPKREWLVPAGLIALSAIPVIAGTFRVTDLASDAPVTPDNARFFASPTPVLVHIVSSALYCLFGAFQFARGFRRRRRD